MRGDTMELKVGTVLTLEQENMEKVEKFHCKIVEIKENIIYIDYPKSSLTQKTAFLVDGSPYYVTFISESNISYAFKTKVIGRKMGAIPTVMLSLPTEEEIMKIQRREFVRVQTSTDVAIEYNNEYFQFVTEDISAGGLLLRLKSDVPFHEGEIVPLTIVLPFANGDMRYVRTKAEVIRIFERGTMRLASLQLAETDEVDKQYIVRFCFERQLMVRKKESSPILKSPIS